MLGLFIFPTATISPHVWGYISCPAVWHALNMQSKIYKSLQKDCLLCKVYLSQSKACLSSLQVSHENPPSYLRDMHVVLACELGVFCSHTKGSVGLWMFGAELGWRFPSQRMGHGMVIHICTKGKLLTGNINLIWPDGPCFPCSSFEV